MTQSRNEVHTDLVDRTERLECNGKEIIVAEYFNIFLHFAFDRAAATAEAAQTNDMTR